jgi:hypothetical protein
MQQHQTRVEVVMKRASIVFAILLVGFLCSCKSLPNSVGMPQTSPVENITLTEDTNTKVNTEVVAQLQQPTEVEILSPIVIDTGESKSSQTPDPQPKATLPEGTRIKLPAGTPVTLPAGTEVQEYRMNWLAWGVYFVALSMMLYFGHHLLKKK